MTPRLIVRVGRYALFKNVQPFFYFRVGAVIFRPTCAVGPFTLAKRITP